MKIIDSAFPEFQQSVLDKKHRMDRPFACLCGLVAFLYYLLLIPASVPVGAPAELIAINLGIPGQQPSFHLLWRALTSVVALIPIGSMTLKMALFSALCNSLTASLIYLVCVEVMMQCLIPNGTRIDRLKIRAIQVGSITAAIAFATTIPVALSATRASLRSLDALLPIAGTLFFMRYLQNTSRVKMLLFAAIICGLGMGESLGSFMAFIIFAIWGAISLWRQDKSVLPIMAFIGLSLFITLLLYPLLSCYVWHLPGGMTHGLLLMHFDDLCADYGTSTGMLMSALTILPLMLTLATLQQTLNYGEEYDALLTNLALASATVLVLINPLPSFYDYALAMPEPIVFPTLLAAMTAGFVSASWWIVGFSPRASGYEIDENDLHHEGTPPIVKGLGYGIAITFTLAILFSTLWTGITLRAIPMQYTQRCSERILNELGSRHWIFGRTPDNIHLAVLAKEHHIPLYVVPLIASREWSPKLQMRIGQAIGTDAIFTHADRNLLLAAAKLGPDVLLRTWLLSDPHAIEHVAIAGSSLFWTSCGYQAVPSDFFFTGSAEFNKPATNLASRACSIALDRNETVERHTPNPSIRKAIEITDQNLAATTMYGASILHSAGDAHAAAELLSAWSTPRPLPAKERLLFSMPLSWIWESTIPSGHPEQRDILHVISHAESLVPLEDSEDYAPVVRRSPTVNKSPGTPNSLTGVYMLARESASQARVDETFARLLQLDQQGAKSECLLTLRAEANLAVTNGNTVAIALLQRATETYPHDMWSWHLLATAYLQHGDTTTVERVILPSMLRVCNNPNNEFIILTRALLLTIRGGSFQSQARDLFVQAADANRDMTAAREWALRLDMLINDDAAIRRDADLLVSCDEFHPQANYALAILAIQNMQLAEADLLFSRSLAGAMTPQAMVGRARLCCQRRMYLDALELAKKAKVEYPSYPDARTVLADVFEKMGKPNEAEVVRSEGQDSIP